MDSSAPSTPAPLDVPSIGRPYARPPLLRRATAAVASATSWLLGGATIIVGLAVLAVVPLLNLLSLGYLLECSGRVARSGRLRDGFVGFHKAAVLGRLIAGTWLVLLPLRFVYGLWLDARLVAPPGSPLPDRWLTAVVVLAALTTVHLVSAMLRGGRLHHFVWPAPLKTVRTFRHPGVFTTARDRSLAYLGSLRLHHFASLGARGFVGALTWLAVPVGFLVLASSLPEAPAAVLSLIGSALLAVAVLSLFLLQARFAQTGRLTDMFDLHTVRHLFRRAPVAFLVALLVTLAAALPLYLLKIELAPRDVAWLPSLVFVVFMFPARLLAGWAMSRANRHPTPRHPLVRWPATLLTIPVVGAYVAVVYLTQYLSWYGSLSLLEQHAFLVPAPMMSL